MIQIQQTRKKIMFESHQKCLIFHSNFHSWPIGIFQAITGQKVQKI